MDPVKELAAKQRVGEAGRCAVMHVEGRRQGPGMSLGKAKQFKTLKHEKFGI